MIICTRLLSSVSNADFCFSASLNPFTGQALGRTILGPKENILSINRDDLDSYIKTNYTADRMVLVGAGGVDHAELVKLAEKHFSNLPVSSNPIPLGRLAHPKTNFVGSEVRIRDDNLPAAHIAIAFEGAGWSSPDYFPLLVMQSIIGNWDRSLGAASLTSSRLSHIVSSNNLANSFLSFSTSYSDTGLWGIYLVSENLINLDDLAHFTLKEWTRLSIGPTEVEVERAKSQLKASLLLSLDGTTAIAEDIGRQLVTSGRRLTPQQIENAVDAVSVDDIKRTAQKYLWDQDVSAPFTKCISLPHTEFNFPSSLSPPLVLLMVFLTTTVCAQTRHHCSTRGMMLLSLSARGVAHMLKSGTRIIYKTSCCVDINGVVFIIY